MNHSHSLPGRMTVLAALLAGLAAPAFATPADVVISQVYGAGGNSGAAWNKDFIELFNRSDKAVSLNGWSVQYGSATGTSWQATALPNVTLQPGQYFLVTGAGGTNGADVGQADVAGTLNLSGTTGKVALSNIATAMKSADGSPNVIDLVGFGTANLSETADAPAPSTVNSVQRAGLGCTDTDNNAADFTAGPVSAIHNSSSPIHSCGGPSNQPIVTNCPASIWSAQGSAIAGLLQASDADNIVTGATIASGGRAGIALGQFTPSAQAGQNASVQLLVDGTVPAGIYPVAISFSNDGAQSNSCTVTVDVAGTHTIPQIQGNGPASPYANTVQSVQGVLTLKVGTGFFIQDPVGDGDPSTSDGVFVYGATTDAQPGDLLQVTGTVSEYTPTGAAHSTTEFKDVLGVQKIGSGYTITPTNVALPNSDLARYEGMLVHFTTPLTVNDNAYLGDRGELDLAVGRREQPTNRYTPGSADALALAAANAANLIVLDDGSSTTPTQVPYLGADGTVRTGDTVTDLTGVINYDAVGGLDPSYKLQPTQAPTISRTNPRSAAPDVTPGNLRVVSANIENFFTVFTDGTDAWGRSGQGCSLGASVSAGNCRGADNLAEFQRQNTKLVTDLTALNADVAGLMEVQNNGDTTIAWIVDQLNAALGSKVYDYIANVPATGTDAIRVAMIYKPAVVTPVGAPLADGDAVNNRAPLAQTFKLNSNGGKFTLVANHLRSKGSCSSSGGATNADNGDGQGCWTGQRVQQAQRLVSYLLPQVRAQAGDDRILLVGDMNSYGKEDPIAAFTGAGFINEVERFERPVGMPYSYVFDAVSGYLDHALASPALDGQVAGITEWHINADEPEAMDYNLNTGVPQDLYQPNPYRESDHDPLVISLNLAPGYVDVTGSVKIVRSGVTLNRVTSKSSGSVTFTNTSGATLAGPLQFRLDGLTAGVTLDNASGTQNGAPYVTLSAGSLAPGASVTVTTTFSNPGKVAIGYTASLISGAF